MTSTRMPSRIVLAAALAVAAALLIAAGPTSTSPAKVTSVEGITEYSLANGLRVLLFPDDSKPTATVNITVLVGSVHENYGETGMAHLLEHLVFKGSPRHKDIPKELTSHGSRPNGSTWVDRTNYFETFAATDENLAWAIDLEADRLVNSYIAKKDLDSEMTVVRNEFEMGENSPQGVLMERIVSTAFLWHNYGKSTIGAKADLENVPIERLQAFYRTWYQPDNAVLVIAGKFDEKKALALVQDKFGRIPRPKRPLPKNWTLDPTQDGERAVTLRRVGDTQTAAAAYHVPAGSHADFAALEVLSFILGDTPSGRLHKALVETKKAATVSAMPIQVREPGLLYFSADLRKDMKLGEASDILLATVEGSGSGTKPVAAEEVERAKAKLLKDWELNLKNSSRIGLEISEWAAMGDWRLMFLHRDRLKSVTPADVERVAKLYLKSSNRTSGVFIPTEKPERSEVPPSPDVAALVKGYKGGAAIAAGEAFDVAPANIDARTVRSVLPSGLKLALLSKKTRGNVVQVNLTLRLGDEKSLQGKASAAALAGSMLMRGSKTHTRQQIKDEMDRLQSRIMVDGGATTAFATVETTRANLPAALRLAAGILRQPSFPASELEILRQEELASVEDSKSDPTQKAYTAWYRHVTPWPVEDPRHVNTPDENIAAIKGVSLDEVKRFHADFYGASAGELAAVGDFDAKELQALAGELFGDWKNKQAFSRLVTTFQEIPPKTESLEAPDKANAFFYTGSRIKLRDDHADYPALVLGNFMTGGGFLNSRIATRLRQKEGLSYGAGSSFNANPLDEDASFISYAIYAPQNAERLVAAYREEIARILEKGFTAEEVAAAKSGWLQSRAVSRAQDVELVKALGSHLYLDRTYEWDSAFEKKVQALTPQEIHAAVKRHIDPAKFTTVQAGDFAAARLKAAEEKDGKGEKKPAGGAGSSGGGK